MNSAKEISKIFTITIVRHGQTTHNLTKTIQGQYDSQLTELGRDQAKLLGEYYKATGEKFNKVYCSDLTRAYETCQIICGDRYEIIKDQRLKERSFGILQGFSMDKLRSEAYKAGHDESNFTSYTPEGGETMDEVMARLEKFVNEQLFPNAMEGESILIVTHGGVIRELMKLFKKWGCNLSRKDMIISPNTGISRFQIKLDEKNSLSEIEVKFIHTIPHLESSSDAKFQALNEEQLNEVDGPKREIEYAI